MSGQICLTAVGFADEGTPELIEWMRMYRIKDVVHIGWANAGIPEKSTAFNDIEMKRMEDAGFNVCGLSMDDDVRERLRNADAVYLNGGNPAILRYWLRNTSCDNALRNLHKLGIPIIGASAGAIVLGSGSLSLTSRFAAKPKWGPRISSEQKGLGFVPEGIIPHHSREKFPEWMIRLAAHKMGVPDLTFIKNGDMVCTE